MECLLRKGQTKDTPHSKILSSMSAFIRAIANTISLGAAAIGAAFLYLGLSGAESAPQEASAAAMAAAIAVIGYVAGRSVIGLTRAGASNAA